ncbi:MAG: hypothetical protein ABIA93_00545 [Candidatus Woesearchaeota archaeon]
MPLIPLSAKKLASKIRWKMRLGKSLNEASEYYKAKGLPDALLRQAILLVDTGDEKQSFWNGIGKIIFSTSIVVILILVLGIGTIAYYSEQGTPEKGILLVTGYAMIVIVLTILMHAIISYLTASTIHNKFVDSFYAISVSELAIDLLLSFIILGNSSTATGITILVAVMIRQVVFTVFLKGGSQIKYFALGIFFTVASLILGHFVGTFAQTLI